jgi:hypothetical protein
MRFIAAFCRRGTRAHLRRSQSGEGSRRLRETPDNDPESS